MRCKHATIKRFVIIISLILISLLLSVTQAQDFFPSLQLKVETEIYDARWSPDGQVLAVAGVWGVKIFDPHLKEIAHLDGHRGAVVSVSWRPDSQQLASAGGINDGTLHIWNRNPTTEDYTLETVLSNNHEREFVVVWSPDSSKIASIGADAPPTALNLFGETEIWDTTTWVLERVINLPYQKPARSLVWTSNSTTIIGAGMCVEVCPHDFRTGIYFADVTTGEVTNTIETGSTSVNAIALSSTGNLAFSNFFDIFVYDVQNFRRLQDFSFNTFLDRLAWSPDGSKLAFGYDAAWGGIIDAATGTQIDLSSKALSAMTGLDWHPNGNQVVTTAREGLIEIWDTSRLPDVSNLPTLTPLPTLTR